MSLESVNRLAELTGVDRRTINKRLKDMQPTKDGRANLYPSELALPLILQVELGGDDGEPSHKKLDREKARLTELQADKADLEVKRMAGDLIPATEVVEFVSRMIANARARFLALPTKAAPEVVLTDDVNTAKAILEGFAKEALAELAEYRQDEYAGGASGANTGDMDTPARTDRKPVGRRKPQTKRRGKRGGGTVAD